MTLLVKAKRDGAEIVRVTPQSAGWNYVGFAAYRLAPGEEVAPRTGATDEVCIVVLSGTVTLKWEGQTWREIGGRSSVFEQRAPYAVYLPRGSGATILAHTPSEIGVASAPGTGRSPARLIEPGTMKRSTRGEGLNERFVCDILPQTESADHLLVVEVITPGGHSSSYPPHKHDTDNLPLESSLEETYYHRLNPSQGFAFQRVLSSASTAMIARSTRRSRSRITTWSWSRGAIIRWSCPTDTICTT